MQKSKQFVQPSDINNRSPIVWYGLLSILLCGGMLSQLLAPLGSNRPRIFIPVLAALLGWFLYAGAAFCIRRGSALRICSWVLRLLPWFAMLLNSAELWRGMQFWINCILTHYNTVFESALRLFPVEATAFSVQAFSFLLAFSCGAATWSITHRRCTAIAAVLYILFVVCSLLIGTFSALSCALMLAALLGLGMSTPSSTPSLQAFQLWTLAAVAAVLCAVLLPGTPLESVDRVRTSTLQQIHTLRYGAQTLPEGDLARADALNAGTETCLTVQAEQEKALYLRGFIGSRYQKAQWSPLRKADYSNTYSGMLRWLYDQGFDPLTQSSQYYALSDGETPEENHVIVQADAASRYYMYLPISLTQSYFAKSTDEQDSRIRPRGLRGASTYTLDERSSGRPAELTLREAWVGNPQTEEQVRYCEAESVYRGFVYNTYTTADATLSPLLRELFWENYDPDLDSVYSSVAHVRDRLESLVSYTSTPERAPDGTDPIAYFLTTSHAGNAVLYASAAVQALRIHGVPARYVEGYYLSAAAAAESGTSPAALTAQDAHAWVEVYFDGIGWMPVDVTPGYYFDALTLQEMVAMPDTVHKTATLDDSQLLADNLSQPGDTASHPLTSPETIAKNAALILLGTLAAIVLLLTLLLAVLEFGRFIWLTMRRTKFTQADDAGRVQQLAQYIYSILALRGIDACLGWQVDAMDALLPDRIPGIAHGDYQRTVTLLEKAYYGGEALAPFETRALHAFIKKISRFEHPLRTRAFWRLRYFWLLGHLPTHTRRAMGLPA